MWAYVEKPQVRVYSILRQGMQGTFWRGSPVIQVTWRESVLLRLFDSSDFTYIPHFPGAGGLQNPY